MAFRALMVATVLALPMSASGQLRGRTAPVVTPAAGLALPDDAHAVAINPAALGFLDSWSLTYIHAGAADRNAFVRGGHALRFGTPLFLGLAAGASIESVQPTDVTGQASRGAGSVALAWASDQISFGTALRVFASDDPNIGGLTTWDLAASWRPSATWGVSFLARDVSGPIFGGPGPVSDPASFVLATAFRPSGTRTFTLDVAAGVDTDGRVGVRSAAEIAVPTVGRVIASFEADGVDEDPTLRVLGGLAVDWGRVGVTGGVAWGDNFDDAVPGYFVGARWEGARRRGIPVERYVLELDVESLGARGVLALVRTLERARVDDDVAGVFLRFRGSGIGRAYAQELRMMIAELERVGKAVICHFDAGSGAELYACAGASGTYVDPAGGVRLQGVSGTAFYLGGFLRDIGIRTDFVRIGQFKGAVEQYTNSHSSEPVQAQRTALYRDVFRRQVSDLSRDWNRTPDDTRDVINIGPYLAPEAVEAGIVTGEADEHDLKRTLRRRFRAPFREERPQRVAHRWREHYVGVVVVDGDIIDGDNVDIPVVGIRMSGSRTVIAAIERYASDPMCGAIVLRVDSPGGSALASDQIWRAVQRARRQKAVVASLGSVAASGGYYVAAGAQEIWTTPSTVTGSIGVFFGKVDVQPLASRLGIGLEAFGEGDHAGLESFFRPFTPEERALVADKIRIWYRLFLRRVAEGRGIDVSRVDSVARGRVLSGDAAVRAGLVDRIGGFGSALARARELGGLSDDSPIRVSPGRPTSLLDFVLGEGLGGGRVSDDVAQTFESMDRSALTPELSEALHLLVALAKVREDVPMARLETVGNTP